jgi:phage major head subunit gpT-like protein
MAIVSQDISKLLEGGLKTVFFNAFEGAPKNYEQITTLVPSEKDRETYAWLGSLPSMREWIDERVLKEVSEYDFTIENKNWELTLSVDRNALDDDQYGAIKARVQAMGEEASRHIDELVFSLLADGFSENCYDGVEFFSDSHPTADDTQSNTGTGELSAENYASARAQMMSITDDRGKPLGIIPDTVVIPPALEETARLILSSDYYPSGSKTVTNPWKGSAELIVSPYLTDTNNWYLLCTGRSVKPLILQMRRELTFSALEENSERGFMHREFLYGADARYNVGYGLWQLAYGSLVE